MALVLTALLVAPFPMDAGEKLKVEVIGLGGSLNLKNIVKGGDLRKIIRLRPVDISFLEEA